MTLFSIDQKKCCKDGICAAICPRGIIDFQDDDSFPKPALDAEELCISCGHCMAVCPHQALELNTATSAHWPASDPSLLPKSAQMQQLVRGRRSTRVYKNKVADRALVQQLIELSRFAPTARNSQMLEWLVIDSSEELNALKQHVIDWMQDRVDKNDAEAVAYGFEEILSAWREGHDVILRGAPELVILHAPAIYPFALIDSTIAMTTFELAATAEKLATCWAGFFMIAAKAWKPLRDQLNLAEGHALTTALMLGYPKYHYGRLPERKHPVITWR